MKKQCLIITGGSGLLALNWACAVRDNYDVVLATNTRTVNLAGTTSCKMNLEDTVEIMAQLEQFSPDVIIHTVGLTNVEQCEKEPAHAQKINADIAKNVALAANNKGIKFVYISTDQLFSGDCSYYKEIDLPQPLNEYGKSKLLAEELVQQVCQESLIIRTNFFGWGHKNRQSFSDWIIYNLRAGNSLNLYDDIYFTPIIADVLAETIHELAIGNNSGVFNIVGGERISKYNFALHLAKRFDLPAGLIQRSKIDKDNLYAKRPYDMSLSNSKALDIIGHELGSLEDYLDMLHDQELQGRRHELLSSVK
jgi:dTDP-4-dehydrorhamnose reductase